MSKSQRRVSPSFVHVLIAILVVALALTVTLAGSSLLDRLDEPAEQVTLDVSESELGIEVTVAVSQSDGDVLVTRDGQFVGRFPSNAGVTRQYYARRGDTLRFFTLDDAGERDATIRSHTVASSTGFAGRLSPDERPLSNGTVRVAGRPRAVTVTGDVVRVEGKSGGAIGLRYRDGRPAGIRLADLPEYDSYTLSLLVHSDGSDAADSNYVRTRLVGWEDGHTLVAYGRTRPERIRVGTGGGDGPFAAIGTGSDEWHLLTVTHEPGSRSVACAYGRADGSTCRPVTFGSSQGGRSDFVIGGSEFSGEIDEVLLFTVPLSDAQRRTLRRKYFDE